MEASGSCDPFIALMYGGKEAKTSVKTGKQDPFWNEKFVLSLVPAGKPGGDLEVKVMDRDLAGIKSEFVGRAVVNSAVLRGAPFQGRGEKLELPLLDADGNRVIGSDGKGAVVELQVQMVEAEQLSAPPPTEVAPPPAAPQPDRREADSAATPRSGKVAKRGKVEVVVKSARNLPRTDAFGT
eukprot:1966965-Rhodomonas_salina.1